MQSARMMAKRPTMFYWISSSGTILRAESENSDLVVSDEGGFDAPFASNPIVGRNLFRFIAGPEIEHLYQALTARVLKTGHTVNFDYRCDSPGTRRDMSMELSRDVGMVRYKSVLVSETVRNKAVPWQTPGAQVFVAICSFCQNYRFPVESKLWKELEELLMERALPDEFSFTHGICEVCYLEVTDNLN